MEAEADKLLLELVKEEKMDFNEVAEFIHSRNRAQTILANLLRKRLINQEPKNWRLGQKKIYSLTEKGLLHCNQLEINTINESIKRLQSISTGLRSNPSNIKEALFNQKIAVFLKDLAGKPSNPEKERDFVTKVRAIDAPLLDIFRSMHEIIRQEFVEGFKNKELSSTATVIKDGALYLVKPEELKGVNLIPLPV
jgi:hypothetical protein